jgi:Ca2+-binding RTX toxin-like protein
MQPGEGTYVLQAGQVEVVVGSSGDDSIVNGDAESTDVGDYLCGGPGNDYIAAGAGPDHVNGGDGDDPVKGWRGADVVQGNAGNDIVDDGSQDDQDAASDILRGGIGDDTLVTGWGTDRAYGDEGADTLYDTECDGPTLLSGGPGDDHLESYESSYYGGDCGTVADQIAGDTGADTAVVDDPDTVTGVETLTRR